MDETNTDTNNFASSGWMLLNGRRLNAAEFLYRMCLFFFCLPPLKIFYSALNRKIRLLLHWCYLTLLSLFSEFFWYPLLYNFTLYRLLEIAKRYCKLVCSETSSKSLAYKASCTLCKKTSCHIYILWRIEGLIEFPPCHTFSHIMNSSLFVFTVAVLNLTTSSSKTLIISHTQHVYYICNSASYKHLHASYKYRQTPYPWLSSTYHVTVTTLQGSSAVNIIKSLFFSYWSTTNKVYLHS